MQPIWQKEETMPSQQVLFNYFVQYNLRVWPMQIVGYVLCIIILFATFKRVKYSDQTIAAIFAFLWFWLAIMFWLPFGESLPMAYAMAVLFLVQGVLFLVTIARPVVSYRFGTDVFSLTGLALIVFATIFYELLGYSLGHTFPQSLTLGAFPCPTTIFTLGMFLCTTSKVPRYLLIVPSLTAIVLGSSALYGVLGSSGSVVEDVGLLISGLVAVVMYIYRDRVMMPQAALRPAA
jgi:hypothetical protein